MMRIGSATLEHFLILGHGLADIATTAAKHLCAHVRRADDLGRLSHEEAGVGNGRAFEAELTGLRE